MAHIHRHPAPGFGELTPGWWVVPNNPFSPPVLKGTSVGIGQLVAANWTLPQNPLANALSTVGLPPGQKSGVGHLQGLGAINLNEQFQRWANISNWSLGQWAIVIGLGALFLITVRKDRSGYRAAKLQAKADYYRAISEAKKSHPTYSSQVARRVRELIPVEVEG